MTMSAKTEFSDLNAAIVTAGVTWEVRTDGLTTADTFSADMSGATMGAGSIMRYTGNAAYESISGTSGVDILNVGTGNDSATGSRR